MIMITSMTKREGVFIGALLAIAIIGAFHAPAHAQVSNRTPIGSQLSLGSTGANVTRLQQFLATNPLIYPQGIVSGYYGPLTRTAVDQFQIGYGLPPVGQVGPLTLAKINALIAAGDIPDVSAPSESNVTATPASTSATIAWMTNELAIGKVHYATTPISMFETSAAKTEPVISGSVLTESAPTISHSVTLSNLMPNTLYYYVVESIDPPGNVSVTLPATFTTMP